MNKKDHTHTPIIRLTIRKKLIIIISAIILTSSVTMIFFALFTFEKDNLVRIHENNLALAKAIARMSRTNFRTIIKEIKDIQAINDSAISPAARSRFINDLFLNSDSEILYYAETEKRNSSLRVSSVIENRLLTRDMEITGTELNSMLQSYSHIIERAYGGEERIVNVSVKLNKPVLMVLVPANRAGAGFKNVIVCFISINKFLSTFLSHDGITEIFIVNRDGDILAHTNSQVVLSGGNYLNLPIVTNMKKSKLPGGLKAYKNEDGIDYIGSFYKIGFAGLGVIVTAREQEVYASVYKLQKIYLLITVIILVAAMIAVYVFSKIITNPVRDVMGAVKDIEDGHYAVSITPRTHDEIGDLTTSIIRMGKGLEEREKIKQQNEKLLRKSIEISVRNEQLKELNEMKTTFFTNISHEIRTPLTMILSPVESALQGEFDGELGENFFRSIQRNGIRLLKLVNNLLDFSKVESGQMQLHIDQRDIVKVVENYTEVVQLTAQSRGIALSFTSSADSIPVYVDIEKIDRILMNLISNAMKFTDKGGAIAINVTSDDVFCNISITDTGPGIPKDKREAIFDRFSQADSSSTRKYEGTGIGLALAKEFTRMHDGELIVTSNYIEDAPDDHGTTFTLKLKLGKDHYNAKDNVVFTSDETEKKTANAKRLDGMREMFEYTGLNAQKLKEQAEAAADAVESVEGKDKSRVLIVEDNSDMRNYLNSLLDRNYTVFEAVDGQDGLAKVRECYPDIILTDVMMPNMNGNEMTSILKKSREFSRIPIIMLTAKSEQDHKVEGLEFGADDYVTKPFNSKELGVRMRNLLKTYEYEKIISQRNEVIEADLEIAKRLQQKLLPVDIPQMDNYKFHTEYIPIDKIGGDFYDIVADDKSIEIFIADVTGHGVPGAFLAAIIRMAYKTIKDRTPDSVISYINKEINETSAMGMFATAFYGAIDTETNIMRYINNGHVYPIIYNKEKNTCTELESGGMPLGIFNEISNEEKEVQLHDGERILFYTDGITECLNNNNRMYGIERLKKSIADHIDRDPAGFSEQLLKELRQFSRDEKFEDDVCLVVFDLLTGLG